MCYWNMENYNYDFACEIKNIYHYDSSCNLLQREAVLAVVSYLGVGTYINMNSWSANSLIFYSGNA